MHRRTGMPRIAKLAGPALLASIATTVAMVTVGASAQPSRKAGRKSHPVPLSRTAPDTTGTIPDGQKSGGTPSAGRPPAGKTSAEDNSAEKPPASNAATVPQPSYVTTRFGEGLPQPFDLPTAPRARMRTCGTKWQAIKMSGKAHSETWREFATKCLVDGSGTMASP